MTEVPAFASRSCEAAGEARLERELVFVVPGRLDQLAGMSRDWGSGCGEHAKSWEAGAVGVGCGLTGRGRAGGEAGVAGGGGGGGAGRGGAPHRGGPPP